MRIFALILSLTCILRADPVRLEDFAARLFPESVLEAERRVLSEEELATVAETAGSPLPGKIIHSRKILLNGKLAGRIFLDRHRVRTLPETLAIAISPEGVVLGIEVLVFAEPPHYKARPAWLKLFEGKNPENPPKYKTNIDGISGATLTGRAVTNAVLRSLAVHQLIFGDATP